MRVFVLFAALALTLSPLFASGSASDFDAALALVKEKRYPEAQAALEKIVAANPKHAAACHELGLVLKRRSDNTAYEQAIKWLARAVELEPNNATYLGDFGGTSLELAGRTHSISAATKGRDAMEKALTLNPDYLEAREGLFQFYQRAPWPLGSSAKAAAQLEEIRKRDPDLATGLSVVAKVNEKEFTMAFKLCDDLLAQKPENYIALYHYGRAASISGQNLDRALNCLRKCLTLEPPSPASPTHSHVWNRIGNIEEKLNRPAEARAAYEAALKIDPSNVQASQGLQRVSKETPH